MFNVSSTDTNRQHTSSKTLIDSFVNHALTISSQVVITPLCLTFFVGIFNDAITLSFNNVMRHMQE